MTPERQRPAGWQAGQGAMSAACSVESARQRFASDDSRKLSLQDTPLPPDVAERALGVRLYPRLLPALLAALRFYKEQEAIR